LEQQQVQAPASLTLLTAEQVAAKLQVKVSWVHERTRERCPTTERIPHIRLPGGRYVRFAEHAIDQWMNNGCK
jgi:predicted DNA-binding transcriptional regulator AlpA